MVETGNHSDQIFNYTKIRARCISEAEILADFLLIWIFNPINMDLHVINHSQGSFLLTCDCMIRLT